MGRSASTTLSGCRLKCLRGCVISAPGYPCALLTQIPYWAATRIDGRIAGFFAAQRFVAMASLDAQGRPWATVLTARDRSRPVLEAVAADSMVLRGVAAARDPVAACLRAAPTAAAGTPALPWAALGIDFSDRDRVLAAGYVRGARVSAAPDGRLSVEADLAFVEGGGNCPKYIPLMDVRVVEATPAVALSPAAAPAAAATGLPTPDVSVLDADACAIVARSESFFLATRHAGGRPPALHLNFRGGAAGFVRVGRSGASLAWPDYSGNRKYTSLGNIESDGVAGLVFVDWASGDALHVTGTAAVLVGDAAAALLPRCAAAIEVRVVSYVLLRKAVAVSAGPTLEASPYNPRVRLLAEEEGNERKGAAAADAAGGGPATGRGPVTVADVVAAAPLCEGIAAFTLRLRGSGAAATAAAPAPALPLRPGQFVILDFAAAVPPRAYAHMNERRPQSLNDDLVRAYTVSGGFSGGGLGGASELTLTVKWKPGGAVSSLLHAWAAAAAVAGAAPPPPLSLPVLGFGGGFSVFDASGALVADAAAGAPVLFIAAGSGVTPFLAMLEALGALAPGSPGRPRVRMLLSTRAAESALADAVAARGAGGTLESLHHFVSDGGGGGPRLSGAEGPGGLKRSVTHWHRRMALADVAEAVATAAASGSAGAAIISPAVWLCGPLEFMAAVRGWLSSAGVDPARVHAESFNF